MGQQFDMPSYSRSSKQKLSQCHPDQQLIFSVVIQSWDNTILTGHRGKAEQTKKFLNGESKVQWPNSKHNKNISMAVDASPWPIPKKWGEGNRNEYEKFRYFSFYVIGVADTLYQAGEISHVLRWGGDWDGDKDVNDQKFNDLIHFELRKPT